MNISLSVFIFVKFDSVSLHPSKMASLYVMQLMLLGVVVKRMPRASDRRSSPGPSAG
jgi:hypothetical protein